MKTLFALLTLIFYSVASYAQCDVTTMNLDSVLDDSYNLVAVYHQQNKVFLEYKMSIGDTDKDLKAKIRQSFDCLKKEFSNDYPYTIQLWILLETISIDIHKINNTSWEINGIYFTSLDKALEFSCQITLAAFELAEYY